MHEKWVQGQLGVLVGGTVQVYYAKKNKPLILGSYITHLAVQLGVLNLQDHDLHLACDMEYLNAERLERIGVPEHVDGAYLFTPSRPPRSPLHH